MRKIISPFVNKIVAAPAVFRHVAGVTLATSLLAGCAFTQTSDISNPLTRKASWFSYLNADDMRIACSAGEAEGQIRMIYNANYYKEVRSYEVRPIAGLDQFDMVSRVFGPAEVSQINVDINAPLGAFGGQEATDTLNRASYLRLTDALQADGFGYQDREGLRLHSDDYYWVAIGCSSKNITLAAWTSAKDDLSALGFPPVLQSLSSIERDLPEPPEAGAPANPYPVSSSKERNSDSRHFYRTVRGNMLR